MNEASNSGTKKQSSRSVQRMVRLWSNFQYVRHNANRPLEGVTLHGNGGASFQIMPSTLRFGECYDRLPKWVRKLATVTAKKPNDQAQAQPPGRDDRKANQ